MQSYRHTDISEVLSKAFDLTTYAVATDFVMILSCALRDELEQKELASIQFGSRPCIAYSVDIHMLLMASCCWRKTIVEAISAYTAHDDNDNPDSSDYFSLLAALQHWLLGWCPKAYRQHKRESSKVNDNSVHKSCRKQQKVHC